MITGTQRIIADNNLTCTVAQFDTYSKALVINTSMYNKLLPTKSLFSVKYNGNTIENPANGKYYYHITLGTTTFLQNTVPYVSGNVGLNDTNIDAVILDHKTKLIAGYVDGEKMKLTIKNFTPIV